MGIKRIMKNYRKSLSIILALCMIFAALVSGISSNAASGWQSDSTGWYYMNGDSYYAGQWAEIGGSWYYFNSSGYMEYSCYRDGCWLESNGVWNTNCSAGQWRVNSNGWWFEDNGWYPLSQWLWINGSCYYFDESGYMEYSCYRDGCWLTSNGAWDPNYYGGAWKSNGTGWWYEDAAGWYPSNQGLWIDGEYYWFGADGYWSPEESKAKKDAGADGRNSSSSGNGASGNGTGNGSGNGSGGGTGSEDTELKKVVSSYTYEIIPMLEPFADVFYIKTDNPDPYSFCFADADTVYSDEAGEIAPTDALFSDVVYENKETRRVNGGYIAIGSYVDGGKVRLQARKKTDSYYTYNISTGEYTVNNGYDHIDTDIEITLPRFVNVRDYLIENYGDPSKSFFENLSGIQSGFNKICLYSGVYVQGELKKDSNSYYGLSTSPHVDQIYYIRDPYSRGNGQYMLMGNLYPFIYQSLSFPAMMAAIAQKLEPSATVAASSYAHYLVDITYNGTTMSYGGAGTGGGQGINENQIKYFYKFDGSADDEYMKIGLDSLYTKLNEYGAMDVPDERDQDDILTWAKVRNTVGTGGSYVKLVLINSVFGGGSYGYTYMYDDNSKTEGSDGWGSVGHFYNSWFDGRYFNRWEYFQKGVTFKETVENAKSNNEQVPHIFIKDFYMPLPNDGKDYYATVFIPSGSGSSWSGSSRKITKEYGYNPETGIWEGFTWFIYDKETDSWKIDEFCSYNNYKIRLGGIYVGNTYTLLDDATVKDKSVITMNEALSMNLDANTNKDPENYYIYDMTTQPGTYHKGSEK